MIGERDENFNKVSTGGKDAVLDQISPNHPLYDKIMSYYNFNGGKCAETLQAAELPYQNAGERTGNRA